MRTLLLTILLLVLTSSVTLAAVRIDGYECKRGQCFSKETGEPANGTIEGTDFKGRRFQYHFVDGRQDGLQQYYYRNSDQVKFRGEYKQGKLVGKEEWFYESGALETVKYHKGSEKNGQDFNYFENGSIKSEYARSKDGKKIHHVRYFPNGQIKFKEVIDKNDIFVERFEEYDQSGNLMCKGQQWGPTLVGDNFAYYPDGRVKIEYKLVGTRDKNKIVSAKFFDSQGNEQKLTKKMVQTFYRRTTREIDDSWLK